MGLCLIVKSGGGVDTSSATASAEQILSGYTIYRNDNKITGNMTNVGTQTKSGLNAGGSVTISSGYHNGNGSVTTNTLASQTSADIPDSSWCLSGYTYWKNGSKGTGTMTNRGKKTWSLGVNGSQTIEGGWHNGSGAVSQSGVKSDGTWRMLTPKTSQQTLCSSSTYYTQNQWCAGNSNLTASNIKKDITIFGVKGIYIETKRYLIQNGVPTGLCTLTPKGTINPYHTGVSASPVTYNGLTWMLFSHTISVWRSGDDYIDTQWQYDISGLNKIASIEYTWNSHTDMSAKFHFTFGGKAWVWLFDSYRKTREWESMDVIQKFSYSIGKHGPHYCYWFSFTNTTTVSLTSNKAVWNIAGPSPLYNSSVKGLSTEGDATLKFDATGAFAQYNEKRHGIAVWVNALWIDTSGTMSTT